MLALQLTGIYYFMYTLAQAIENLLRQGIPQQLVENMENRLRATSWPVIVQQYLKLYREQS